LYLQLRIEKAMPALNDEPSLYQEVFIPMEETGLEYNNPIDFAQSTPYFVYGRCGNRY
jgi:hypothetical protein